LATRVAIHLFFLGGLFYLGLASQLPVLLLVALLLLAAELPLALLVRSRLHPSTRRDAAREPLLAEASD
jgi:hypothetical protein